MASRQVCSPLCDRSTIIRRCRSALSTTCAAEGGQAAVLGGHRAVADVVGLVVGQLDDAHAAVGEQRDPSQICADLRRRSGTRR